MNIHNTKSGMEFHARVEKLLRKLGFEPMRQFEPKKGHAIGDKELFEIWRHGHRTLVVQFYGGENGVEFYPQLNGGNTWDGTELALRLQATLRNTAEQLTEVMRSEAKACRTVAPSFPACASIFNAIADRLDKATGATPEPGKLNSDIVAPYHPGASRANMSPRNRWELDTIAEISHALNCSNSDAQGVFEAQAFTVAQQWGQVATPKAAAAAIVNAAKS